MEIIEWGTGINRNITNESSPVYGENSLLVAKSENGMEMTGLKSTSAPDVWNVVMYFSNSKEDNFYKNHNITEWDSFLRWFKYKSIFGTKPFYFNKIGEDNQPAIYKIKAEGLPKPVIIGTWMKVSMTWVEFNNTAITVVDNEITGDFLDASNGIIDFHFNETPTLFPKKSDFSAYYQVYNENEELEPTHTDFVIERIIYDGNKIAQLHFQELTSEGLSRITVTFDNGISNPSTVYKDIVL